MSDTDQLEQGLVAVAAQVQPHPGPADVIIKRGRRLRRRHRVAVATSAVAAVALLGGVAVGATQLHSQNRTAGPSPQLPNVAGQGAFLGWGVTGNAAHDQGLLSSAVRTWDTYSGTAHKQIHPLAVQTGTPLGPVVIVEATDPAGHVRLAILTGSSGSAAAAQGAGALRVRVDAAAPKTTVSTLGTVSSRWAPSPGQVSDSTSAQAVLLAQPGVSATDVRSTSVDARFGDSRATGRLGIQTLPPQASTLTTTAVLYGGNGVAATGVPLTFTALGDPQPVPAQISAADAATLTLTANFARVRAGDLVADEHGLIGRVQRRTGGELIVQPVTAAGFRMPARTSISDIGGTLTGTGHSVTFTQNRSGQVSQGNRIEVPLPGASGSVGAITAGRATAGIHYRPGDAGSSTTLQGTAPARGGATAYILTTP